MLKKITHTSVKKVKKAAKILKKANDISHSKALERASKDAGYESYHLLLKAYKNQKHYDIDFTQHMKRFVVEWVKSDYGQASLESSRFIIGHYHNEDDLNPVVLPKLLDVFENGINHDGKNIDSDWIILAYAICKESIKGVGHDYLKSEILDKKVIGALLVALGHFYRSAADSLASRRLVHPDFATYLSDWARATSRNVYGEEVTSKLLMLYPCNDSNGLAPGTTYWKPE